jgi:hypothetical protein
MSKPVKWTILIVLFGGMLALAMVFLAASSVPDTYEPYRMTQEDREHAAMHFANVHGIEFFNKAGDVKPFTHEVTADDLNKYLAALDQIAFLRPPPAGKNQRIGTVWNAMEAAGIADPMVVIDDGMLTVMVRTLGSNKVVSMDLRLEMVEPGKMKVALEGIRVGLMPVPQTVVGGGIEQLKATLAERQKLDVASHKDLDAMLAAIIAAIGEEPVDTTLKLPRDRYRRISRLELEDGTLRVFVEPVDEQGQVVEPDADRQEVIPSAEPEGGMDTTAPPDANEPPAPADDQPGEEPAPTEADDDAS